MLQESGFWFIGRVQLLREIDRRIDAVRRSVSHDQPTLAFRKGLVIYLERRIDRVRDALVALGDSLNPVSEGRRQTIDRMIASMIETLRHAELEPTTPRTANAR
ncbi:MAG TPA: hypothetical protein VJN95_00240 [Gemmatimonadales bacterium]|nr:hypothetical protein [Gemmatimonadales bacterium]